MVNNTLISPGYVSTYGGTLIKRASGWLVLSAISTHGNGGGIWGLAAMTSNSSDQDPAVSPYSAPKLMLFPESDRWHPHPCEFYPCFSSGSHTYCPCTSLQANRGFQVLYRARLEAAHLAESWEVYQAGSLYHWDGAAGEDCAESGGIWGQTFTGFVDESGGFQMMYPSRAKMKPGAETCDGTINLARAPNFAALRSHGFWVSGPGADSMTAFSQTFAGFDMNVTARLAPVGGGWTLRWNWRGEIGPSGAPVAGARMDPRGLYSNTALCFDGKGSFSVIQVDQVGSVTYLAEPSPTPGAGAGPIRIQLSQSASHEVAIKLDGTAVVSGLQLKTADVGGSVAVHVTHGASVHVIEMVIAPTSAVAQRWLWLTASDGITGGGDAALGGWKANSSPTFRTGQGFTSAGGNRTMAKYSFIGVAARLHLPKGPEYGSISVTVDGGKTEVVDLHAEAPTASAAVFEWHASPDDTGRAGLANGHALVVRWISGGMAADGVEFLPSPIGAALTQLKTTDGESDIDLDEAAVKTDDTLPPDRRYECVLGAAPERKRLKSDDDFTSDDSAYDCHWAIVLGENTSSAGSALDRLDPTVRDRFKFDHILLGEYWKHLPGNIGFHFPGKAEGGLSGLMMNECPYSNLSNASYTSWSTNYAVCMEQHISTLPQLFDGYGTGWDARGKIPQDWAGLVVWDFESFNPSWAHSTWSLNVEYWQWFVANISTPTFDKQFSQRVGYVPPLSANGWANLNRTQRDELMETSYNHFGQDYFERTLAASKKLRPKAQWGIFSYPFVAINGTEHPDNYPPYGYYRNPGETAASNWQTRNDRLGWLWSLLDVFLPQLYPAGYVTAAGTCDNPCGESYSAADNERFISSNMLEMNRLREKFSLADIGTPTPILPFWWQHMCDGATKLCHNNMTVWMSDLDIQQHFELTANSSDGMIMWGDPYYFGYMHEDQGVQITKSLVDLMRYKALLKQHCSLKTDDTVPPPMTNCTATCTCAFGPKTGPYQCGIPLSKTLPNIMLLSDSIGAMPMGYYTNVVALFGNSSSSVTGAGAVGNAKVHHSGGMGKKICGTSFGPAACIDFWFSGGGKSPANKYDVIHFNWGLHDIDASAYAAVTPEQYAANMEEIYLKMKRYLIAGGSMIWATSTPVPPSYRGRKNVDVLRINQQMAALFGPAGKYNDVFVSDLYGTVVKRCNNRPNPNGTYPEHHDCDVIQSNGVHMSAAGRQYTALVTAGAIAAQL